MPNGFYKEFIEHLKKNDYSVKKITQLKRDLSLKYGLKDIPTNINILFSSTKEDYLELRQKLITKPIRTISGVSPIAIMTKPYPCPHELSGKGPCTMCPGGPKSVFGSVPQSYTGKEPASMRAIRNNYDPYLQVFNRLEQYVLLGHNYDKIELILMGGTFPSFPREYQEEFVTYAFKAMNDFSELFLQEDDLNYEKFKQFFELSVAVGNSERTLRIQKKILELKSNSTLEDEQKRNETAKIRCVALCIETRPDYGFKEHGLEMLKLGCTRVELGVQSVYDPVLEKIKRGHGTKESIQSIKELKDLGFKVAVHYMPGLPLTNYEQDLAGMKELFSNPNYCPDMLKLYPCMVTRGTELYKDYQNGTYHPLDTETAAKLIAEFKPFIPEYCRVIRVQRDIPTYQIEAGVDMTNLRQYMFNKYQPKCRCIRCREPKGKELSDNIKLKILEYDASGGKEFFLSLNDEDNDLILGFLRLRFPSNNPNIAFVRELHVYGQAVKIGEKGIVQHKGYGKLLMKKAEEIVQENNKKELFVISGVGVREYYKKLNYHYKDGYMVKTI
jgi:elongator complex protein 3